MKTGTVYISDRGKQFDTPKPAILDDYEEQIIKILDQLHADFVKRGGANWGLQDCSPRYLLKVFGECGAVKYARKIDRITRRVKREIAKYETLKEA